jgi:6-phospho-beta-glucosidase
MDIDGERLDIIAALIEPLERRSTMGFRVTHTTDPRPALAAADYVITTFRVGGIASRIVDERVPLSHGVLGQETTGPGGFAMAMRSIPVLLGYLGLMRELCPEAWLVNFANPAGLLAEAAIRIGGWERTVGICDAPQGMWRVAAALLGVPADTLFLDYFGLNHLGWVRAIVVNGRDHLPHFIEMIRRGGGMPGLPFVAEFIAALGLIPNEYLYYYYHAAQAVHNILRAGQTRGEQIAGLNRELFAELARLQRTGDLDGMARTYRAYLSHRGETYMAGETAGAHDLAGLDPAVLQAMVGEGYAGVALDLIESLAGTGPRQMILNVPNRGAIHKMDAEDVVEVPAYVGTGEVRPLAVGQVPEGPLGLMKQIKEYERLTIAAATEGSYARAAQALTVHPLVRDYSTAIAILDGYREQHGALFPELR